MMSAAQRDFEAFYLAEKDTCLRVLVASTGDLNLAEDVLAEAFARAWARWPAVSRHPTPAGWVLRTAFNLRVSWWRKHHRERPLEAAPELSHDDPEPTSSLLALLATLPERQRQVLSLRVLADLDTRQTAAVLGIAEGTVTAHLHRATQRLRADLTTTTTGTTTTTTTTTTGEQP